MSGVVAGIDLGQSIGWVRGGAVGPLEFSTYPVQGGSNFGLFLDSAATGLRQIIRGCDAVAVEQPFMGQSYYPCRKLMGMLGVLHWLCKHEGIAHANIVEVPVSTGKLTLSGRGNADAPVMISAALERGFTMDEHQAHALGLWEVYQFGAKQAVGKRPRSSKGVSLKHLGNPSVETLKAEGKL